MNWYMYCAGNPVKYVDPSGHDARIASWSGLNTSYNNQIELMKGEKGNPFILLRDFFGILGFAAIQGTHYMMYGEPSTIGMSPIQLREYERNRGPYVTGVVPDFGFGGGLGRKAARSVVRRFRISFRDIRKIFRSMHAPYKGSTKLGHALSKHAGRNPKLWGKITGKMSSWHKQGMRHIKEILRNGKYSRVPVDGNPGKYFHEFRLLDGRGLRLNMDMSFKCFID